MILIIMANRKIRSKDLADQLGILEANLSILKTGKPELSTSQRYKHIAKLLITSQRTCWNLRNDQAF